MPDEVRAMDVSYDCVAYDLGARQQRACDVVDAVADAMRVCTSGRDPATRGLLRQVADVDKKAAGNRWITSINMGRVEEEYERLQGVLQKTLGEPATEPIAAIKQQLFEGWSGEAANAFADYFERMSAFVVQQKLDVTTCAYGLAASYTLGANARLDFKKLADDATSNINQFLSDQTARSWATTVKVLGGIVAGAYSGAAGGPEGATIGAVAGIITGGIEVGTATIGGPDAQQILGSVTGALTKYFEGYANALAEITQRNPALSQGVVNNHLNLFDPLPAAVDIDSPDFSYQSFLSAWEGSPEFTTSLTKEQQKHRKQEDIDPGTGGRIQTRLLGDSQAS